MTLKAFSEVKVVFPQTKGFIDERPEQKCLKENLLVEEVFFLQAYKQKVSAEKHFFIL